MQSNNSQFNFSEESMRLMFTDLVKTQPEFIGGSSNSIIVAEFPNFIDECKKHETHIPFFEIIVDPNSTCEHKINGEPSSSLEKSGVSYYSNGIDYYFNSSKPVKCTLLGINPVFFKEILIAYGLQQPEQYLKDINNNGNDIRVIANRLRKHINQREKLDYHDRTFIDYQSRSLLSQLIYYYFKPKNKTPEKLSRSTVKIVLDWIDYKIEENEEIRHEEALELASVENSICFFYSFKFYTGKTFHVYCMDRRIELFERIKYSVSLAPKKLSSKDLKKALEIIHERVKNLKNGDLSEEAIVKKQLVKELALTEKHIITAFSGSMGISPKEYYQKQRMKLVKDLLLTTDDPVKSIAIQVGYNGQDPEGSLRRAFQRCFETCPSQFRREYK